MVSPLSSARVTRNLLEEDDEIEEENPQTRVHGKRLGVPDGEVAAREQLELQHRLGSPPLIEKERGESNEADDQRNEDDGAAPAMVRLLNEGEHDASKPQRAQPRADEIDPSAVDPCRPRHRGANQRQRHEDKRHVHREDPAPGTQIDDKAPRKRPHDRRDPSPGCPRPDRGTTLSGAERGNDDRKRTRRNQRPCCTL